MSTSIIDAVGDALAQEINDQVLAQTIVSPGAFTAQRASVALSEFAGLTGTMVLVIPDRIQSARLLTRGRMRGYFYLYYVLVYGFAVGFLPTNTVQQNNAILDPYKLLTENVSDWFGKSNPLTHYAGAQPMEEMLIDPLCDPDLLTQFDVYGAAVEVPVYLLRQM